MQRVMINLINNAILAVNERRDMDSETEGHAPYRPRIRLSARNLEDSVAIEVEDNGVGMNETTVQQAFDPLFTTRARGTGLGLAIVRKIVEEHGGSASIETEPNRGTKVTVILPVRH